MRGAIEKAIEDLRVSAPVPARVEHPILALAEGVAHFISERSERLARLVADSTDAQPLSFAPAVGRYRRSLKDVTATRARGGRASLGGQIAVLDSMITSISAFAESTGGLAIRIPRSPGRLPRSDP
ncbi:MAG TPA: hypothetical protein VMV44_00080 [Rectinemataceae bacterium]|nr:hypothetical protein [Rectinemataceae bacterium]